MSRGRRPTAAGLLRLYPGWWRQRYGAEMEAMLEDLRPGRRARFDLVRGALDARLHGPTRVPGVAAILAGGLWTVAGAGIVAQAAPPDWPGYQLDALPLAMGAVVAGAVATVGCWALGSDAAGRPGTAAVLLSLVGHVAWFAALIVAATGGPYGAETAVTQALGVLGTILVGLILLRGPAVPIGALLVLGATPMLFGAAVAWLILGLAWTLVGTLLLARVDRDGSFPARLA